MAESIQQLVPSKKDIIHKGMEAEGRKSRDRKDKLSHPTEDKMGGREQVRPESEQGQDPLQALALTVEPL